MPQDYEKIRNEIEQFFPDGKVTKEGKLQWLQLRKAIRIGKYGEEIVLMQNVDGRLSAKHYENMYKILEWYCYERDKRSKGSMGTKKIEPVSISSDEINAEEIPF